MDITPDTFIISDTHFGHKAALKKHPSRMFALNNTGFKNFDDLSLHLWNSAVSNKDTILHLGDLFFGNGHRILPLLNGKKILIVGNNDVDRYRNINQWRIINKIKFKIPEKKEFKKAMKKKWGSELKNPYATGLIIDIAEFRIMFSHFPVGERKNCDKYDDARNIIDYAYFMAGCNINIHGHLHEKSALRPYCFNASTEKLHFTPRKLSEILKDFTMHGLHRMAAYDIC